MLKEMNATLIKDVSYREIDGSERVCKAGARVTLLILKDEYTWDILSRRWVREEETWVATHKKESFVVKMDQISVDL